MNDSDAVFNPPRMNLIFDPQGVATRAYRLFALRNCLEPFVVRSLDAENILTIGSNSLGSSSTYRTGHFSGCSFAFSTTSDHHANRPAWDFASLHITDFENCRFSRRGTELGNKVYNFAGNVFHRRCMFDSTQDVLSVGKYDSVAEETVALENCWKSKSGGAQRVGLPPGKYLRSAASRIECPHNAGPSTTTIEGIDLKVVYPTRMHAYHDNSSNSFSLVGTTLTFSTTNAILYQVGDILSENARNLNDVSSRQVACYEVTDIDGSTITAEAFVNPDRITSTTSRARIARSDWATEAMLVGQATSGSPTITGIASTAALKVGDWVTADYGLPVESSYTRTSKCRIVSLTSTSITLNQNANVTGTIYPYWCRLRATDPLSGEDVLEDSASSTLRIPFGAGHFNAKKVTLTASVTDLQLFTARRESDLGDTPGYYTLIVVQDGTGGHGVTFTTSVNGTLPTLDTAADAQTVYRLYFDGTEWHVA